MIIQKVLRGTWIWWPASGPDRDEPAMRLRPIRRRVDVFGPVMQELQDLTCTNNAAHPLFLHCVPAKAERIDAFRSALFMSPNTGDLRPDQIPATTQCSHPRRQLASCLQALQDSLNTDFTAVSALRGIVKAAERHSLRPLSAHGPWRTRPNEAAGCAEETPARNATRLSFLL
ncbi:hypothetical protein BV25DRAFT_1639990 [Artomyces pyxidatus]|uniref:Uncharacterized protein n=1 Tax=Artomyces pyxidatus TaxID=48021 RepID=A0ACB8SIZ9_9AGAM|nr:hypothetical protein BV25DRAFT_1639990 [Artomyces pyxidatus]